MVNILIVEDDENIRQSISEFVNGAGYQAFAAEDGEKALDLFYRNPADLVVLDLMLPKLGGIQVLSQIRRMSDVPILILTALENEQTQLNAFELKADDYVTKPFIMSVLIKRIESLLRRAGILNTTRCVIGNLRLEPDSYKAYWNDADLELTVTEFELLHVLALNSGTILTRNQLLDKVWGFDFIGEDRIVDAHVKNIRHKVPRDIIKTVRGVGYELELEN